MRNKFWVVTVGLLLVISALLVYIITRPPVSLQGLEERLALVEGQVNVLDDRVLVVEARLDALTRSMGVLMGTIVALEKRVAALEAAGPLPKPARSRDEEEHRVPVYVPRNR